MKKLALLIVSAVLLTACQPPQDNLGGELAGEGKELYVICKETVTGFDPEEYAQNSGGVCVQECPENFDSFVTQIGVEVCIPHYGKTEIEQWETCEKSADDCQCAKAYETTDGEEIENAQYRCVPDDYAERLLFRGGLDRLDEKGEQSVVIA